MRGGFVSAPSGHGGGTRVVVRARTSISLACVPGAAAGGRNFVRAMGRLGGLCGAMRLGGP